jgi:hypothetical protein
MNDASLAQYPQLLAKLKSSLAEVHSSPHEVLAKRCSQRSCSWRGTRI